MRRMRHVNRIKLKCLMLFRKKAMLLFTPRTGVSFLLVLGFCALPAGCGKGDGLELYPVSGTVLLDGKPLTNVAQGGVSFYGDAAKGNKTMHIPTGMIDAQGKFELITGGEKGALLGSYKVLVNAFENTMEEGPVQPRLILNPKYYDMTKTDLSIEVVAKPKLGQYDLHVTK